MPRRGRRAQREDGRDETLRKNGKGCSSEQHQCRTAPVQRRRVPPPNERLGGVRLHPDNRSILGILDTSPAPAQVVRRRLAPEETLRNSSKFDDRLRVYVRSRRDETIIA